MSVHGSLKDKKFSQGKGTEIRSHSGQRHASARKQGLVLPGFYKRPGAIKDDETDKPTHWRKFS